MAGRVSFWNEVFQNTHVLPAPVFEESDFIPKRVVVPPLLDTGTECGTGMTMSY